MRRWLWLGLLVVSAGVLAARLISSSGFLSTTLACLGLAFLPGYLLLRLLGRRLDLSPLEKIPVSFGLSVGLILLAGTATLFGPISLHYLTVSLLTFAGVLAVVEVCLRARRPSRPLALSPTDQWVLAGTLALAAFLSWSPGFHALDDYIYAGIVRSMQEAGRLFPAEDYFYLGSPSDPRAGLGQFALALIGTQTGYGYLELWDWLMPFLAFQLVLSAYFLARRLSSRPYFVGLAVLFFGLFFRIKNFRYVVSHSHVATILLLPALGWVLEYVRKGKGQTLLLAGLFVSLAAMVHPSRMLLALLALGSLGLAVLVSRKEVWPRTRRLAALAAGFLPAVIYCALHVGQTVNPYFVRLDQTHCLVPAGVGSDLFLPNPDLKVVFPGRFLILAGLIGVFYFFRRRRQTRLLFLSACILLPLLIQFNPWTFTYLARQLSYNAAVRLVHLPMIAVAFFFAFAAVDARETWPKLGRWGRLSLALVAVLSVVVLYPDTLKEVSCDLKRLNRSFAFLSRQEEKAAAYLAQHAPRGAVICADEWISCALPGLTGCRVVAIPSVESTASHADQMERVRASETILSPKSSVEDVRQAARRFRVQYVLLRRPDAEHPVQAIATRVLESLPLYRIRREFLFSK